MENNNCPICDLPLISFKEDHNLNISDFNCSACGQFSATYEYINRHKKENVHFIQGALRERQLNNLSTTLFMGDSKSKQKGIHFTEKELLKSVQIPENPAQKIEKFLENLSKVTKDNLAENITINRKNDFPLCYSKDAKELDWIWKTMNDKGYFHGVSRDKLKSYKFQLSIEAWEKIETLKHGNNECKQGFIACSFGEDREEFITAIENGIEKAGFNPMCIKDKYYTNSIMNKALSEIRKSKFVIVDLTNQRNPVSFESGYVFGLKINCIFVIQKKDWDDNEKREKVGFYEKHYKINIYEKEKDLEKIIETAIKSTISIKFY